MLVVLPGPAKEMHSHPLVSLSHVELGEEKDFWQVVFGPYFARVLFFSLS